MLHHTKNVLCDNTASIKSLENKENIEVNIRSTKSSVEHDQKQMSNCSESIDFVLTRKYRSKEAIDFVTSLGKFIVESERTGMYKSAEVTEIVTDLRNSLGLPQRQRTEEEEENLQKVFSGLGPAVVVANFLPNKDRLSSRLVLHGKDRAWMTGFNFPFKLLHRSVYMNAGVGELGKLETLQWLRSHQPPCPWGEDVCYRAAQHGHLEVLKWVRSQNPPCPWDEETCIWAAFDGHLEVLKWVRSQNPPCPWDENTCSGAAANGHLEVLKWLRSQNPPCPWDEETCCEAAKSNETEVLRWLIDVKAPDYEVFEELMKIEDYDYDY